MMTPNQYFRAGVGMVLYTPDKQIYIFRRSDLNSIWQFPQGGIDAGETPEDTLWRELEEETGLTKNDTTKVTQFPDWLKYEYDTNLRHLLKDPNCLGQIHRWYFIEIKTDSLTDLKKAIHDEFSEFKVTSFEELLSLADPLKGHVFKALASYFASEL